MNFITPSVELLEINKPYNLDNVYKHIEYCGRTCYRSHDRITPDSAIKFVENMKKSGHGSVLEHGAVYLLIPQLNNICACNPFRTPFENNKYSREVIFKDSDGNVYSAVSTNMRVIVENKLEDYLQFLCNPLEIHEPRITFKFTTDIGVTREFNRHRVNSPSEESTRYCNYSKDKFGGELSIALSKDTLIDEVEQSIITWAGFGEPYKNAFINMCYNIGTKEQVEFSPIETWLFANLAAQWSYMKLINLGWKAQQARRVLPLDTKSELVHTAYLSDWLHFLSLRSPKYGATGVHPDAAFIADKVYDILKERYNI